MPAGGGARRFNPSAARNRTPLLAALRPLLTKAGVLLELGSGTGQHAAFMAPHLPHLVWAPSEPDAGFHDSIAAWAAEAGAANVMPPRALDATWRDWSIDDIAGRLVAVLAVNLLHVAPWDVCRGLMAGAGRYLPKGGLLALYGPYLRAGVPTGEGNRRFDSELRAQNPEWGLRQLEDVAAEAAANGLDLGRPVEMPANNLAVVFTKASGGTRDNT